MIEQGTAAAPCAPIARAAISLRGLLRESTREDHAALDCSLSLLDLASARGYRRFLLVHWLSLTRLAGAWRELDARDFRALLLCLRRDLHDGGEVPVDEGAYGSEFVESGFRALGVAYVIRGSRLGSRQLRRRVPHGFPTAYLDHALEQPWQAFVRELDGWSNALTAEAAQMVIAGAKLAFGTYAAMLSGTVDV